MPGQAPVLTDERDLLLAFLDQQRDGIRFAAFGLTDEQARLTTARSTLTIGGLVKHMTDMERGSTDMVIHDEQSTANKDESSYESAFSLAPGETLADALAAYDDACTRTDETVRSVALDADVPVPKGVPWYPADLDAWSVRWVILHLIEETARHSGHADIVRESIDGATMFELMAGVEGWPATDWLTPWQPPSSS